MFQTYPKHIYSLLGIFFISRCFTFIGPLIAAFLIQYTSFNAKEVSICIALSYLLVGCVQPSYGKFLDKGHYLSTTIISISLFTVGIGIFIVYLDSQMLVVTASVFLLLGTNFIGTTLRRCVVGGVQSDQQGDMGTLMYIIFNAGLCCAGLIGFFFLEKYRNEAFILDWITTVLAIVAGYFALKKHHHVNKNLLRSSPSFDVLSFFIKEWKIAIAFTLLWVGIFTHAFVMPLIYEQLGINPMKWTPYLLVVNTGTVVLLGMKINNYLKPYKDTTKVLMGSVLYVVGQIAFPYALSPIGMAGAMIICVLGEICLVSPFVTILYQRFDKNEMGVAAGIESSLRALGMFLCPILGFLLFQISDNIQLVYAILFGTLPLISYALLRDPSKKQSTQD